MERQNHAQETMTKTLEDLVIWAKGTNDCTFRAA